MSGPKVSKDEYFKVAGMLTQLAASTDGTFFGAFRNISRIEPQVCRAIYYAADSHAIRRAIVRRVTETVASADLPDIDEIAASVEIANRQRNELAHSVLLGRRGNEPDIRSNPRFLTQHKKPVTRAYLNSLLKESQRAKDKAVIAFRRILSRRPKPLRQPAKPGESGSQA